MNHRLYYKFYPVLCSVLLLNNLAQAAEQNGTEDIFTRISEMLQNGGGLMWVMLLTSVIGLTYTIERVLALRLGNYITPEFITEVDTRITTTSLKETELFIQQQSSIAAQTFRRILARQQSGREEMERIIDDDLSRALWDERKNIKPIGMVASIAPLLGLLGTVVGMIDAFRQASENGMNDPAIFAGGIYQALYTTAFGLILAIPFFIIYNYLKTRSEFIMRKIEDESLKFVDKVVSANTPATENDTATAA